MGGDDEAEDDETRTLYPYERLVTTSEDPAPDIDLTKREVHGATVFLLLLILPDCCLTCTTAVN